MFPQRDQLRIAGEELVNGWMPAGVRDMTKSQTLSADLHRAMEDDRTPGDVRMLRPHQVEMLPLELPPHAAVHKNRAPVTKKLITEAEEEIVSGTKCVRTSDGPLPGCRESTHQEHHCTDVPLVAPSRAVQQRWSCQCPETPRLRSGRDTHPRGRGYRRPPFLRCLDSVLALDEGSPVAKVAKHTKTTLAVAVQV